MTDSAVSPTIDPEVLKAQNQAMIDARVKEMQDDLVSRITGSPAGGRYGKSGPGSWDKLQEDTVELTKPVVQQEVEKAKKEIREEFEAKEKARADELNKAAKQSEDDNRREWEQMSREWREAVTDGIIPDISPEVKAKLKVDPDYGKLSEEEQKDPGLVAYNQARALHIQLKREGKSNSFYRTVDKFLGKMPAGASAPVLGGSTAVPQKSQDFTYAEVHTDMQRKFRR